MSEDDDSLPPPHAVMSEAVRKMAVTCSFPPFEHKFVPTGHFECSANPSLQIQFGELEYGSPNYVMHGAVEIKEWLFCLEQSCFQPGYYFCAFVGREHFTFGRMDAEELVDAQRKFVSTCMLEFCPMLFATELEETRRKSDAQSFTWIKNVANKEK